MPSRKLLLLCLAMASINCGPRSGSRTPCPSLPPVAIDPPATSVDCRVALTAPLSSETLAALRALPRCRTAEGSPMPSADLCWTSGEASLAGTVIARLLVGDARVRRCLELAAAAGGVP